MSSRSLLGCLQEDAHAAVLQIDPSTQTGFFGVFDGHGGQEVAKYCSLRMVWADAEECSLLLPAIARSRCIITLTCEQAQELVQLQSYQDGRLADALQDVYLHVDTMLASEATRAELDALAGPKEQRGVGRSGPPPCFRCLIAPILP